MDTIGTILYFATFLTPFLTIPLCLKYSDGKKIYRVLIGLLLALFLSYILYNVGLAIIFRDGMGPV